MKGRVAIVLCAAAGYGLGGCGSAALQTATPPTATSPVATTVIFDCSGRPHVRPGSLSLFCADDGEFLTGLHWRRWGTAAASGTGRAVINTCTPDCAAGHTVSRRVTVAATGLALNGTSATYELLTVRGAGPLSRFSLTINGPVAR